MSTLTQKIAGTFGAPITPEEKNDVQTDKEAQAGTPAVTPDEPKDATPETPVEDKGADVPAEAPVDPAPEAEKATTTEASVIEALIKQVTDLTTVVSSLMERSAPTAEPTVVEKSQDDLAAEAKQAHEALTAEVAGARKALDEITAKADEAEARYAEIMQRSLPTPGENQIPTDADKLTGFITDPFLQEASVESVDKSFVGLPSESFL